MTIISETIAENIAESLRENDGLLWQSSDYEIQDCNMFLLIQIAVFDNYNFQKIESSIKNAVGDKIPARKDDYYWMAVLLNSNKKVIDSILPEMLKT